jgi:MOSC domain-containing protein YiiM
MPDSDEPDIAGRVDWIGLRPTGSLPMNEVQQATVEEQTGLLDDRFKGRASHRQVTLFQIEHLDAIAALMRLDKIEPSQTRRNIGVSGINLHGLIESQIEIGECILLITGDCPPCQRMETTIGTGGLKAMSGLGGVTASVVRAGTIRVGDRVHRVE